MSDLRITCTSIDCPERHGGECNAALGIDTDEMLAELFLSESNEIEGISDGDSLKQAKYAWDYLISQDKLDGGVILKTHKILMLHQKLRPNERGYWRTCQVWVGNHEGADWRNIPNAIAGWLGVVTATEVFSKSKQYMGIDEHKEEILAERIKTIHVMYERIHPFIDGNGRTGRMFMNWQRLKAKLPLLIIFDQDKHNYYEWFK